MISRLLALGAFAVLPLAADVVQERFLALHGGARFDCRKGSLGAYLQGNARHFARKRIRQLERETEEAGERADDLGSLRDLLAPERAAFVERAAEALSAGSVRVEVIKQ